MRKVIYFFILILLIACATGKDTDNQTDSNTQRDTLTEEIEEDIISSDEEKKEAKSYKLKDISAPPEIRDVIAYYHMIPEISEKYELKLVDNLWVIDNKEFKRNEVVSVDVPNRYITFTDQRNGGGRRSIEVSVRITDDEKPIIMVNDYEFSFGTELTINHFEFYTEKDSGLVKITESLFEPRTVKDFADEIPAFDKEQIGELVYYELPWGRGDLRAYVYKFKICGDIAFEIPAFLPELCKNLKYHIINYKWNSQTGKWTPTNGTKLPAGL